MALKKVSNIGSGVYFREIDLTIAVEAAGTFAGGAIVLAEKGPAFEVLQSASFLERTRQLGGLNPSFPASYYAKQFLEQANNYKEVRMLGLEGYKDTTGFVIMYNRPGSTAAAAVTGISPVVADLESIACVLKPRRTDIVGTNKEVVKVEVLASPVPTDEEFTLLLTRTDATTLQVKVSLRPESKEYISKVFGTDPRDLTTVAGQPSGLWVEFIIPSIKQRATATGIPTYYYPGDIGNVVSPTTHTSLDILDGDMTVDLAFVYPSFAITNPNNVVAAGTVQINYTGHPFSIGDVIEIQSVAGAGNITNVNSTWVVSATSFTSNSFLLEDQTTGSTALGITGSYTANTGSIRLKYVPTWESEVLELGGSTTEIPFQTPITPWFVSDVNANGEVKRLFRFWSISDGEAANTEIKIEVSNINPAGHNGLGSFDIYVRDYTDQEDTGKSRLEGFQNLCMDPDSDDYILRRIGDGEDFQLRSRYIFIEMNTGETLPIDALPYGAEGYPNLSGIAMPDVVYTTEYNFSKSLNKQGLGLSNNNINTFSKTSKDYFSFKNVADLDAVRGKGFHLNPNNSGVLPADFTAASQTIYQVSATNTNTVTPSEKVRRSGYVVSMFGGFDAWDVYKTRDWATTTSKDFESLSNASTIFSDRESIDADFSVLVTPDINFQEHPAATELVFEMVQERGDALYLFDFRYDLESDPQAAADDLSFSNMRDSHGACYFPHVQIEDQDNRVNVWLPASIIALATIASTATNEQVWQPPAGSLRTVTSNLVRTRRRMKVDDREILKAQNVNPITLFPGSGFEITESRTTQQFFSALSFVHNRLLLGYAKKALNQTLRPLLHQLNGGPSRNAFVTTVTPIFDRIKKLNGLEEFKVVVLNESDDRTTLNGQVEIVPLYPIERIIVDFKLVNNSLQFSSPTA